MKILRLFKIQNLALLAFTQLVFRYGFLAQQEGLPLALNHWQFTLLVLASVLIAAGGFLMEAISGADKYNAGISEAQGYNIYGVLNIAAIGIGYYLSSLIGKTQFIAVFVIAASMLYFAVTNFRQTVAVPNILVSIAAALSIIIIGIYDFYPFLGLDVKDYFITMFRLLLDYALLGFILALIYTLVTDLENTDTDYNSGKSTLPILLGKARTAKITFALAFIATGLVLYYANAYLRQLLWAVGFGLLFIVGPMIYFLIKIWSAKSSAEFRHLGIVIKIVMLFAALSSAVITYNISHNA